MSSLRLSIQHQNIILAGIKALTSQKFGGGGEIWIRPLESYIEANTAL